MILGGAIAMLIGFLWRLHRILLLVAFAGLHTLAYGLLNVPYYHWYGVPVHLCVGLGIAVLLSRFGRWAVRRYGALGRATAITVGVIALYFAAGRAAWRPLDGQWSYPRSYEAYHRAVGFLTANAGPTDSVGTMEIGVIGLGLWPRPIVDACGLVHPDGPAHLRAGNHGWWILVERPGWVIAHDEPWGWFEKEPLEAAVEQGLYERVDRGRIASLQIYRRTR